MSIAEVREFDAGARAVDRTPPQDLQAEQSVLGAMLMSKDAIADVVDTVKGRDFYRPAHEFIYEAVLDLYGRGEPADAITVAAELTKRGEIAKVGGHPYLHDLLASVSVAANAGYYAAIVREKAILRRLVEASVRIAQMGYAGQGDVSELVDAAQAEVYAVTDGKTSEDYQPLSALMESTLDEIEAIGSRSGDMAGVPTGFIELDELTNGLHSGQMIILAARPAVGKALALDTPLPTPTGWTTMGEVGVGDQLLDAGGRPTRVVAATDVLTDRPCYRITFSDGTQVVADAQHQWRATSRAARRAASERRPAHHHFPAEIRRRTARLAEDAGGDADRRVTYAELVAEAGDDLRYVLHAVLAEVGMSGREQRQASGDIRSYLWHTPVYSRREALATLARRVARPIGDAHAAVHDEIVTTEQMAREVTLAEGRANWAVANAEPLDLPERELLVPPYALGVWLGDGHSASARFTSADPEVAEAVRQTGLVVTQGAGLLHTMKLPVAPVAVQTCVVCGLGFVPRQRGVRTCGRRCGGRARGTEPTAAATCPSCGTACSGGRLCAPCQGTEGSVQARLRTIGVLGDKHIPIDYLRASRSQRWALLQGLMDTDGTVLPNGSVQITLTNERLAHDVNELVCSLGVRVGHRTRAVRGRSQATSTAHVLTFSCAEAPFQLPRKQDVHAARLRPATSLGHRYIRAIEPVPGVPVRCVEVDNPDHLYLATRAMVPTHNSTLGLDFARAASIKNGLCSAIFSLEMSKTEITMRLLSAEAQIPLNHIRKGTMTDEDWTRLAKKMGEVSEAPLFVDDSPNLTMMEIRAKARRLKQRHDLKLIIIDYMQLMTSGKKVESRQLEVSEFSRQIKLLAKELEIPIIAMSQLNRGPEQRTDKKPMLSDLRESGCLTAATRILRSDTGAEVSLGDLLEAGETNVPVWSLDAANRLVSSTMTHVFPSGHREVFAMRLASGRTITATANHPFLTLDGWRPLDGLAAGTRLATPRTVPEPLTPTPMDEARLIVLAHMIGDGSAVKGQPIRYASVDEANLRAVTEAAETAFSVRTARDDYAAARVSTLRLRSPHHLTHGRRNPIAAWLDELGLFGLRSHQKFLPAAVFAMPDDQVRMFIRHLWATDGSVRWDARATMGRIYYATTSRRLADDLCLLLLRCDIVARVTVARTSGYRDCYHVVVSGVEQQLAFCEQIGVHGQRGQQALEVADRIREIHPNTNCDTIPAEVWTRVRAALVDQGMTHRQFAKDMEIAFCGSTRWKHAPSRARLGRAAEVVGSDELRSVSQSDVYWDRVVEIASVGYEDVFDATVLETHNFIADGIAVHNSLEQDADMVILLHREDMYDKESSRLGEADFIVAKHRNGPTKTVEVAFQGHYSRFVDMQH